jgi:hypothetical protein
MLLQHSAAHTHLPKYNVVNVKSSGKHAWKGLLEFQDDRVTTLLRIRLLESVCCMHWIAQYWSTYSMYSSRENLYLSGV